MQDENEISSRLKAYLAGLSDLNQRWATWLTSNETAAFDKDARQLEALGPAMDSLMHDMHAMIETRSSILADASSLGIVAPDLQSLARRLPAWQDAALRRAVLSAKQQIAHLRRLHAAAWVLIHELASHYGTVKLLLTQGQTEQHIYTNVDADNRSGQLLDTDL